MIINLGWLKKYVPVSVGTDELASRLTFAGLETTPLYHLEPSLKAVKVAQIIAIKPHPNANRLTLCTVNTGDDEVTVVCGAPNVAVGQKVPLAMAGTTLPNGLTLKKAVIRGVESAGMICAEDELGLSSDHSGIMVLPPDVPLGTSLWDYFHQEAQSFEVELTPNRPDCASHIGIAREVAVLTDTTWRLPEFVLQESGGATAEFIQVTLKDTQGCPRYAARLVRNVQVGPSPAWLVRALQSVGQRSINNIVDAANYVLLETGHPLHTFDYDQIQGRRIIVRRAEAGEVVTTLDGVERRLSADVLLICDAVRPVAIAGIMGLANSEIGDGTRDVLIESAYFQPQTIRKGAKYLGLQTEASYRFERGADIEGVIFALNRAAALIAEIAGGEVCQGVVDAYPSPYCPPEVRVRFRRINALIGKEYEPDWVVNLFKRLGCQIKARDVDAVTVVAPTWRHDLEREVDYIEEVLRVDGMNAVPLLAKLPVHPMVQANERFSQIEKLRTLMVACGYTEHFSNSLVSAEEARLNFEAAEPVQLYNPLSQEMAYLRTAIIPGLIAAAQRNIYRRQSDLQLFELGYVQAADPQSETTSRESLHLGVLVTGDWESSHWAYPPRKADFFVLKGLVDEIAARFGLGELAYEPLTWPNFTNLVRVTVKGATLAWLGQVEPIYLLKKWDLEQPLWILELDGEVLFRHADLRVRYQEPSVYPPVERDLSIVVPRSVAVGELEALIIQEGGAILRSVRFYDLYTGKNIDNAKKSLTFRLVFQNSERTLQDEEVDERMQRIYSRLNQTYGAQYR